MPDATGKLTEEEKAKVIEWLKQRWKQSQACPVCGSTSWFVADHMVQPVTIGGNLNITLGGLGYPHAMLISPTCGYTMFLNAVLIGLYPATEKADESANLAEPTD